MALAWSVIASRVALFCPKQRSSAMAINARHYQDRDAFRQAFDGYQQGQQQPYRTTGGRGEKRGLSVSTIQMLR